MELIYNDEQLMLQESVLRYGADHWPAGHRDRLLRALPGTLRARWKAMADLGWTLLAMEEADGGLGGSGVDVMAFAEGLGRHLIAMPWVTNAVLVPALVAGEPAAADLLAALGAGEAMAAAALLEAEGGGDPAWVETRAALGADGEWRLSGLKAHVEDGGPADWLVVSARLEGESGAREGIGLFLIPATGAGVTLNRYRAVDGHVHARLALQEAPAIALDTSGAAITRIELALDRAICAGLAEATGSMSATTEATIDYLRTREQFGGPISRFQVLQHRAVDMTIACEEARSILWHATLNLTASPRERGLAVAAGKVRIGQSGLYAGQQAVQLHGGVGFCEELIVSHHLRRQMMLETSHGGTSWHLARHAALSA